MCLCLRTWCGCDTTELCPAQCQAQVLAQSRRPCIKDSSEEVKREKDKKHEASPSGSDEDTPLATQGQDRARALDTQQTISVRHHHRPQIGALDIPATCSPRG